MLASVLLQVLLVARRNQEVINNEGLGMLLVRIVMHGHEVLLLVLHDIWQASKVSEPIRHAILRLVHLPQAWYLAKHAFRVDLNNLSFLQCSGAHNFKHQRAVLACLDILAQLLLVHLH